jgi:hypothetical protein
MNDRHSPKHVSSQPRRQGSGVSLLDALHESRRRQALRAIDDYHHLLGEAKAAEVRRATEELTRERVSIRSLCRVRQPHFSRISLLMKRIRAWTQGCSILLRRSTECIGRNPPKGTINMSTKFSFDKAPPQSGGKPHLIDRGGHYSTSGQMSVLTTVLIIAILVGFAVLHVVGFMLMASDQPMALPVYMYPTD